MSIQYLLFVMVDGNSLALTHLANKLNVGNRLVVNFMVTKAKRPNARVPVIVSEALFLAKSGRGVESSDILDRVGAGKDVTFPAIRGHSKSIFSRMERVFRKTLEARPLLVVFADAQG